MNNFLLFLHICANTTLLSSAFTWKESLVLLNLKDVKEFVCLSLSASASTNFTTGSFAHNLLDSWLPSDRTAFTMFVPAYLRRLILSTQKEGFTMKEGSERTWAIYWEHVSSWLVSLYNYTLPFKRLGSVSLCKFLKLVSYAHQVCFIFLSKNNNSYI